MTKEQKIFYLIGQVVVYGSIFASFVGMMCYGLLHATTL